MTDSDYDRVEAAAQALFALGLHDTPQGVLSASGAQALLDDPNGQTQGTYEYAGLNVQSLEVRRALNEFINAAQEIGQPDLTI